MKLARTYIFDAFVNLFGQSILLLVGLFMWTSVPGAIVWGLAAAGFSVFLSVMERGAESRRGADPLYYFLFVLLPVNITALTFAVIFGVNELIRWNQGYAPTVMVITPFYPIFMVAGSVWISLVFLAVNRLTRPES